MRYLFIYVMKTVLLSCFFPFILRAVWIEKLLDTKENTHETQSLSLNQKSTSAFEFYSVVVLQSCTNRHFKNAKYFSKHL